MYLWRKRASPKWWAQHGAELQVRFGNTLAVIEWPDRTRLQVEITSESTGEVRKLAKTLGGRIEELPGDWLRRALSTQKTKPIRVGGGTLIIPASAAFGTGEHATTAMSLRALERIMRFAGMNVVVDVGTGSGILALAASRLGAKRVIAIDNDSMAISVAKQNARLNTARSVKFQVADVRRWRFPAQIDIVTANLFSELLIAILPKIRHASRLILSGIMREQEADLIRAMKRNKIEPIEIRRRGKWIAILGSSAG